MFAELFTIADGVDTGVFLFLEPHQCGVTFATLERFAAQAPGWPKLFGFSEPFGLRQAACDCGSEHAHSPVGLSALMQHYSCKSARTMTLSATVAIFAVAVPCSRLRRW